jgi:heptaprenyl diphosphate synthase
MKISLEEKLTHPFLEKYIPSPNIDEDKLLLFYAIFDEIDLSDDLKKQYIMTAMLVQIALDTHDNVTTQNDINSTEFVQRQLTALAGDYFSGLYYFMLSEIKDINMVRTLAVGIKEINEHKLRLYHDKHVSTQSIIDSLLIVETALFQQVSKHLQLNQLSLLSTKFLTYKRLSHEKLRCLSGIRNQDQTRINSQVLSNELIIACSLYFEETSSFLETSIFKNPAIKNLLLKRLKYIRFHETLHDKKTVEEGL